MSKLKKRNEYAAQATEPDFAGMTDRELLEYVEVHPFTAIEPYKHLSAQGADALAKRHFEYMLNALPPAQQNSLALELNSLASNPKADLKAVYRRYFPHNAQFVL